MIHLRPHHLLCTQGYSGKGYDESFVAHMNEVVHELRNVPGTKIMLTFSTAAPTRRARTSATRRKR